MIFSLFFLTAFLQLVDPIETALRASEAPNSVRIAFEAELRSDEAVRVFVFDPRLEEGARWRLKYADGEDGYLDEISATWGAEAAPDGRLFPDDLRASFGNELQVSDVGPVWKLAFQHAPSANDGAFDIWAAERLQATAWLSPVTGRFLRIDYTLPAPVRGPEGGKLLKYNQSYLIETDPVYKLSLITSYNLELEARGGLRTERRQYAMQMRNIEVFFATPEDEARFIATNSMQSTDLRVQPR